MNKSDLFGYAVTIRQLSEDDGGGWIAQIPEIGGCIADGESVDEALEAIKDMLELWLISAKKNKKPIPLPKEHHEPVHSGKFTVRLPKTMHQKLAEEADREGVSLNQLVNNLLAFNLGDKRTTKYETHYHILQVEPNEDFQMWSEHLGSRWSNFSTMPSRNLGLDWKRATMSSPRW